MIVFSLEIFSEDVHMQPDAARSAETFSNNPHGKHNQICSSYMNIDILHKFAPSFLFSFSLNATAPQMVLPLRQPYGPCLKIDVLQKKATPNYPDQVLPKVRVYAIQIPATRKVLID